MTNTCRALLVSTLLFAACAPLREQRQLSVTETRSQASLQEAGVLAAPSAEAPVEPTEEPALSLEPKVLAPKDCLVLGRAVERVHELQVIRRDESWRLEGQVELESLNHESYFVRIELIGPQDRLIATLTTPVKGIGPALTDVQPFAVDLPEPAYYESIRLGLVSEAHAHERLSLWR